MPSKINVNFNDFPLYSYISGSECLMQYSGIVKDDGSRLPLSTQQLYQESFTAPNVYTFYLDQNNFITSADFANRSMLAQDVGQIGQSLSKTMAVFTTHYNQNYAVEKKAPFIVPNVGDVTSQDKQLVSVFTYVEGAQAVLGMTVMILTNFNAETRT